MPQLDVTTYSSQLFWLVICFVTLYWAIARVTIPKIASVLDARQHRIDETLKTTNNFQEQALDIKRGYEKIIGEAKQQAQESLSLSFQETSSINSRRRNEFRQIVAKRISTAEQHILKDKRNAMGDLKSISVDITTDTISKITPVLVDPARVIAAVSGVLNPENEDNSPPTSIKKVSNA